MPTRTRVERNIYTVETGTKGTRYQVFIMRGYYHANERLNTRRLFHKTCNTLEEARAARDKFNKENPMSTNRSNAWKGNQWVDADELIKVRYSNRIPKTTIEEQAGKLVLCNGKWRLLPYDPGQGNSEVS